MIRTRTDPKIDRIHDSWLRLSREDAVWLASVADEVDAAGGTRIGHHRFCHIVLAGADAGTIVDAGAAAIVLHGRSTVLVLTRDDAARLTAVRRRHVGVAAGVTRQVPATG